MIKRIVLLSACFFSIQMIESRSDDSSSEHKTKKHKKTESEKHQHHHEHDYNAQSSSTVSPWEHDEDYSDSYQADNWDDGYVRKNKSSDSDDDDEVIIIHKGKKYKKEKRQDSNDSTNPFAEENEVFTFENEEGYGSDLPPYIKDGSEKKSIHKKNKSRSRMTN